MTANGISFGSDLLTNIQIFGHLLTQNRHALAQFGL
jgi:hypothetical protein